MISAMMTFRSLFWCLIVLLSMIFFTDHALATHWRPSAATRRARSQRNARLQRTTDLPMNCLALFSQNAQAQNSGTIHGRAERRGMHALRRSVSRLQPGDPQSHPAGLSPETRPTGVPHAKRLELNHAEGIGEARENKDVRRRQMRGQILAGFSPKIWLSDNGASSAARCGPSPITTLDPGRSNARKTPRGFFRPRHGHGHENRSRQIKLGRIVGCKEVGVDAARPGAGAF